MKIGERTIYAYPGETVVVAQREPEEERDARGWAAHEARMARQPAAPPSGEFKLDSVTLSNRITLTGRSAEGLIAGRKYRLVEA